MAKVLGIGDTGEEVRRWQEYLISQGYKIQADSKFGPSTLAATRAMQRKLGVRADGKVGHRTTDRQATTQAQPMPRARPAAPAQGILSGPKTGEGGAYQSAGREYDPAAMRAAASNNAATDAMARELQGQYYDARKADLTNQGAPPSFAPAFTDQPAPGTEQTAHGLDPAMMAAQGVSPNFDAAGPTGGGGATVDLTAAGGAVNPMGAQAGQYIDPVKRDAIIRALLQQAGG